jgi:hypothetical protein
MALPDFLAALFEHGRLRVPRFTGALLPAELAAGEAILANWHSANRLDYSGAAPEFVPAVACWAAEQFQRACQFAVYRDLNAATLERELAVPCPAAAGPAQHYNVDLVFRFLPDLDRLSRAAAEGDPLCERLRAWGQAWPLSSVGMRDVTGVDETVLCEHSGLLRTYVDRVLARRDTSRLAAPRIRAAAREAFGFFTELDPSLAAELNQSAEPSVGPH